MVPKVIPKALKIKPKLFMYRVITLHRPFRHRVDDIRHGEQDASNLGQATKLILEGMTDGIILHSSRIIVRRMSADKTNLFGPREIAYVFAPRFIFTEEP